jgi:D-sedoheptulose 7-phosphate isomerase
MDKKNLITQLLTEASDLKAKLCRDAQFIQALEQIASVLIATKQNGGTIYLCGNGGSAADAMHFTEELVARYKRERPGIKAMHFIDGPTLTCWGNDYGFNTAFARQAETFCSRNDVLIGFSTSGNSENVILAFAAAKERGCKTIAFLGKDGGRLKHSADYQIIVPHQATERIQEIHIVLVHILCEIIETHDA